MKPLISVIVPVYMAEGTIHKCLVSILGQTCGDIEVIAVYRPSEDGTLTEMKKFSDSRLMVVEQAKADGPGGARNQGIDMSRGDFIGFVEADDWVDANFYERLLLGIDASGADIAFGCLKDQNGRVLTRHKKQEDILSFKEKMRVASRAATFDKLFRASFLKGHGIRCTETVRYEDGPFMIEALYLSNRLRLVPRAYYHYCPLGSANWEIAYKQRLHASVIPVLEDTQRVADKHSLSRKDRRLLLPFLLRNAAIHFIDDDLVYRAMVEKFGFSPYVALVHFGKKRLSWIFQAVWVIRKRWIEITLSHGEKDVA